MPKKLYIKTHGCQMNEYDSEKMAKILKHEENFELTSSEHEADLIILNTCSIREKAQERVFHQIGRWRKIKDKNPDLKIAIGGCVASQEGDKIMKRAPEVDIVMSAIVGAQGLLPTFSADCAGKVVLLGNEESLVMAGKNKI